MTVTVNGVKSALPAVKRIENFDADDNFVFFVYKVVTLVALDRHSDPIVWSLKDTVNKAINVNDAAPKLRTSALSAEVDCTR